jgi:coatomer subunit beta'
LWKTELGKINEKAGQSLADPEQYENLFPGFQEALKTQQFIAEREPELLPASYATKVPLNIERDAMEEMRQNESKGGFQYSKLDKPPSSDDGGSELAEKVQQMTLAATSATASSSEPPKARKNSLDEFDFDDEDLDENIDTSDVNLDDEELLSD